MENSAGARGAAAPSSCAVTGRPGAVRARWGGPAGEKKKGTDDDVAGTTVDGKDHSERRKEDEGIGTGETAGNAAAGGDRTEEGGQEPEVQAADVPAQPEESAPAIEDNAQPENDGEDDEGSSLPSGSSKPMKFTTPALRR